MLMYTGAKKLSVERANLKLFLDDGFEIDEDPILLSKVTENRILVLSATNEFVSCSEFLGTSSAGTVSIYFIFCFICPLVHYYNCKTRREGILTLDSFDVNLQGMMYPTPVHWQAQV